MKTTLKARTVTVLCAALSSCGVALAQNIQSPQHTTVSSSTSVNVRTINGQSVVTLNGQQVYAGPTKGHVTSRSSTINGVAYSAVYDGDAVLWENVPGAAKQLQAAPHTPASPHHQQVMEQHQQTVERMKEEQRKFMQAHGGTNFHLAVAGGSSGGSAHSQSGGGRQAQSHGSSRSGAVSVSTKTVHGSTVITYQGKEISVGPTQGRISSKTKSIQGKEYAAVFDGDRVIWENIPGAALQLK